MALPCGGYFDEWEFSWQFQDHVVHRVRSDPSLTKEEKKWLILCWFQVMAAATRDPSQDIQANAARAIREFLRSRGYRSIEEAIG